MEHETLKGTISKIFFSTDSQFFVAKAKTSGGEITITGVGRVREGQFFSAEGVWVTHPRFGRQFKSQIVKVLLPATRQALVAFFQSGTAKNIGESFAHKIVDYYGEKLSEILSGEKSLAISLLKKVPGVGKKRAEEIVRAWKEETEYRELVDFCVNAGVGPKEANKILKSGLSLADVQKNPYRLLTLVDRPDFLKIDRMALAAGVPRDGEERFLAATRHILRKWGEEGGHTAMKSDVFLDAFSALLSDIPRPFLSEICAKSRAKTVCVPREGDFSTFLFLNSVEERVSKNLSGRLSGSARFFSSGRNEVPPKIHVALSEVQESAVRQALKNPLQILSGGPGTGKTTIVKAYTDALLARGLEPSEILLCAPTGRAARRLSEATGQNAWTIHKAIGYGQQNESILPIDQARAIVVDECSMVDVFLFDDFLSRAPRNCPILFVGDPYQLPSIAPGRVLGDLLASGKIPTVTLTDVYRQKNDSVLPKIAADIKKGQVPPQMFGNDAPGLAFLSTKNAAETADALVARVKSDLLSHGKSLQDIQVLTSLHQGPAGTISLNRRLQDELLPAVYRGTGIPSGLQTFFVGDRVMQTKNDYDKEVMNGEMGVVTDADPREKKLTVEFDDGSSWDYRNGDLDNLQLAYAITVHKSQGGEYNTVYMVCDTSQYIMLERHLFYTGVTRSKENLVLIGQQQAFYTAIKNEKSAMRDTLLGDFLTGRAKPVMGRALDEIAEEREEGR